MKIDILRKRLEALEAATFQEAITLQDGSKWTPRVPLLDMFVSLLDWSVCIQLGTTPEPVPDDVREDAVFWAKRRPLAKEQGILFSSIAAMSKELLEVSSHAEI